MASPDTKYVYPDVSPVEVGKGSVVNVVRRRLPKFSLEVRREESSFAPGSRASNADFDPIPPSKRTWGWPAFLAYWMSDAWAVSNWEVASSILAVGLSWKMAIGACVLGNAIMGIVITVNGRIGAILHTPFPVIARLPFGYYFAYFVVLSRCVLAVVWLGVIAPVIFLAIFGSTLHKAGGTISHSAVITQGTSLGGSALAWAFFRNLNGVLGNYATLGLNISDFSRYASKSSSPNVQAIIIPIVFTVVGMLGIFTAAAAQTAYGRVIWNPIEIIDLWMESGSTGGRVAAAFGAIGLIIVTLGINIAANSISAANDLMSFCPKYINIRRGQLLAAVIGSWGFVPWKILASAAKFLAFLGGYTIFLGPMTSIIMTDYYIVRRGNVSVPDMYNFNGIYRYSQRFGTNWRAVVAFFIGCIPPLPGFVDNIKAAGNEKTSVSVGGQNLFAIGYIYSFVAAAIFYVLLNRFFPHTESIMDHAETGEDIVAANDAKRLEEQYATCHAGVSQSPISLHTASGLATTHTPDFSGYTSSSHELSGTFFNWGFGPAFTITHEGTDFTTLPALKFDDRTVYLTGWHIHTPSEHVVDGVKARGEVHLVHVDESGEAASVVALRIDASKHASSAFLSSLPQTLIHFNDSTVLDNVVFNPIAVIEEVGGVQEYWTYEGSLTTPPCSEGLRWFVPKQTLQASLEQLTNLLGVARFSIVIDEVDVDSSLQGQGRSTMEETSTFNPAALTRSETITPTVTPKNGALGSSSSNIKTAKSAHSYPRIDFEPLYTELKSLISDNWHVYHNALSRFIQGQLSAVEFGDLCDHFLLSTPATEHAHNSLICAIIHNAGRDSPEPGLAAFISLASDKLTGTMSSKHAVPSRDGAEQRLKAEIMALPARERRRLKAITTDANAAEEAAHLRATYEISHQAARIQTPATTTATSGSGITDKNWSLEIRKRYTLPLFSESLEFPDTNSVHARIVPICYEAGLVNGSSSHCAELIQTAMETFLKNMLHDVFNRVRANGPRYDNGAGSGIFTAHFKRQLTKEEAQASAGQLGRNRDDDLLPVESRVAQNRRPLSVADLKLANAVGPTLFNGMPTVGASLRNMLLDVDFTYTGRSPGPAAPTKSRWAAY
ncbi:hypothetical protein DV735_g1070, partial [Chaetothyriales sp. CBS 134920]